MKAHPQFTRLIVLGLAALLTPAAVLAQGAPPPPPPGMGADARLTPEERVNRLIERMEIRLELTDQQSTEIRGILEKAEADARVFLEQAKSAETESDARDLIRKAHQVRHEANKDIMKLLDKEQRREFKDMLERMEELRGRVGSRGAPGGPGGEGGRRNGGNDD